MNRELKEKIIAKYKTVKKFAELNNLHYSRVVAVINGREKNKEFIDKVLELANK